MVLTKAEKEALKEKFDNPSKKVLCPRCGAELQYIERGNSVAAECPTEKCIFAGVRGL